MQPVVRASLYTKDLLFSRHCQELGMAHLHPAAIEWDVHESLEQLAVSKENRADICFIDYELLHDEGFLPLAEFRIKESSPPLVLFLDRDDWEGEARAAAEGISHCLIKGKFDHSRMERMVRFAIERKKVSDEVKHKNLHFSWTGLPNRRLFVSRLQTSLQDLRKNGKGEFVVALFDVDKFGRFNDAFGFSTGDQLLLHTSNRLRTLIGNKAFLSHSSADQFICMWENVSDVSSLTSVLSAIEREFKRPIFLGGQEVVVRIRCGLVVVRQNYSHPEIILRDAARACDRSKLEETKIYSLYEPDQVLRTSRTISGEGEMRRALSREEFEIFYQPMFALPDDKCIGFESLVRWHHPSRGMLLPKDFIPLAEQSGLMVELGDLIMRTACAQAKYWEIMGYGPLKINLNFSAKQFYQYDILRRIRDGLLHSACSPSQLVLEITESTLMNNIKSSLPIIRELADYGVEIALDDFGTGQSSLVSLRQFPLKSLKIDGSFVRGISTHKDQRSIVQAILSLGRHLEKEVWAESVETNSQLEFLSKEGCHGYQGFLVSPALTSGNFTKLLDKGKEALKDKAQSSLNYL